MLRETALAASLTHIYGLIDKAKSRQNDGAEEVVASWAVTMLDSMHVTYERCLVLTTAALYRVQWLPSILQKQGGGYIKKCRRMPLKTIHRVYKWNGRVTILERTENKSAWSKLMRALSDGEPDDARPWRENTFVISTRWYVPSLVEPGRDQVTEIQRLVTDMVQQLHKLAPWSIPPPERLPSAPHGVNPAMRVAPATGAPCSHQGMCVDHVSCDPNLMLNTILDRPPPSAGASSGIESELEFGGDWATPSKRPGSASQRNRGGMGRGRGVLENVPGRQLEQDMRLADAGDDGRQVDLSPPSPGNFISTKMELPSNMILKVPAYQERIPKPSARCLTLNTFSEPTSEQPTPPASAAPVDRSPRIQDRIPNFAKSPEGEAKLPSILQGRSAPPLPKAAPLLPAAGAGGAGSQRLKTL